MTHTLEILSADEIQLLRSTANFLQNTDINNMS